MSYRVTDRDHERLVHDLDLLSQVDDLRTPSDARRRHWLPRTLVRKHTHRLGVGSSRVALS